MNTTPDDELLALWVEDELAGPSAAAVEAWASAQPEWLQRREVARQMKPLLANLPAAEEPPYAEFFNARIAREIARESVTAVASTVSAAGRSWRWFLPLTAVAGMVLCFWVGTRIGPERTKVVNTTIQAPPPAPTLYIPEKGVKGDYFTSEPADAMVIVLDGVAAIPDSFEVPETAAVPEPPTTTADIGTPAP